MKIGATSSNASHLPHEGTKIRNLLDFDDNNEAQHAEISGASELKQREPVRVTRWDTSNLLRVNPKFSEPAEFQLGFAAYAEEIVSESLGKQSAPVEFRNTYFHRGLSNIAVACGVLANSNSQISQRFIYTGMKTIRWESEFENFPVLWDKLCVQTAT